MISNLLDNAVKYSKEKAYIELSLFEKDNSVIVSYISGDGRVPSAIHEATTKLVAADIIRMDDQSVLIAEK